jgi:flagellar basal-body rod protein FlgG
MSDAFAIAAVGLGAQQRALDGTANNIANVNTPSFKRNQIRFADLASPRPVEQPETDPAHAPEPRHADASGGVTLDSQFMLNEQGEIERTNQPTDLAIQGKGFIELMGPGGRTLLWRGGALKVGEDGALATAGGIPLRAAITVPADATALQIGSDGLVRATLPDSADPVELGQIQLVQLDDPSGVERLDGGLYRVPEGVVLNDAQPGEDGAGLLVQGAIERSNVSLTDEMVRLMLVQRAYAANAQIVQAADQMMAIANGLRR